MAALVGQRVSHVQHALRKPDDCSEGSSVEFVVDDDGGPVDRRGVKRQLFVEHGRLHQEFEPVLGVEVDVQRLILQVPIAKIAGAILFKSELRALDRDFLACARNENRASDSNLHPNHLQ